MNFRLDMKTSNPLNNSQGFSKAATFYEAKHRKKLRQQTLRMCTAFFAGLPIAQKNSLRGPVQVLLTRIAPSDGLDAHDGLRAALKPVADGVADFLGTRDNDKRIQWDYAQERGRRGEYAIKVSIEARRTG